MEPEPNSTEIKYNINKNITQQLKICQEATRISKDLHTKILNIKLRERTLIKGMDMKTIDMVLVFNQEISMGEVRVGIGIMKGMWEGKITSILTILKQDNEIEITMPIIETP
jgi:hypothetical protein